jgi:hypothetical protein
MGSELEEDEVGLMQLQPVTIDDFDDYLLKYVILFLFLILAPININ